MLIHGPKVVHPRRIERMADNSVSKSCCYLLGFRKLEISSYDLPMHCLLSYTKRSVSSLHSPRNVYVELVPQVDAQLLCARILKLLPQFGNWTCDGIEHMAL
jgi:hypothetical protein